MILLTAFFIIGFVEDFFRLIDFKATQENKAGLSSIIGFLNGYGSALIFLFVITANLDNPEVAAIQLFFYWLGGSFGNYVAIKYNAKERFFTWTKKKFRIKLFSKQ